MQRSLSVSQLSRKFLACVFLCASVVIASGAANEPSGETVAVVQATTASGPGGNRTLAPEKPIYSGDRIVTGDVGTAQIRFRDNTRFVVGPRSSVVIDKYIFNPDGSLAGASLQMTRGAFRFISGNGPKKNYAITTPTATIGIRGTKVDIAVADELGTGAIVYEGEIILCKKDKDEKKNRVTKNDDDDDDSGCIIVPAGCGAGIAGPTGELEEVNSPAAKEALIKAHFPLVEGQDENLLIPFRVSTLGCFGPAPIINPGLIIPLAIIGGVTTCAATDVCLSQPASR